MHDKSTYTAPELRETIISGSGILMGSLDAAILSSLGDSSINDFTFYDLPIE